MNKQQNWHDVAVGVLDVMKDDLLANGDDGTVKYSVLVGVQTAVEHSGGRHYVQKAERAIYEYEMLRMTVKANMNYAEQLRRDVNELRTELDLPPVHLDSLGVGEQESWGRVQDELLPELKDLVVVASHLDAVLDQLTVDKDKLKAEKRARTYDDVFTDAAKRNRHANEQITLDIGGQAKDFKKMSEGRHE